MSAVEETDPAPLDPGTPDDSATQPPLVSVLVVDILTARLPSIPAPTDISSTSMPPEDPGDAENSQTVTESDVVEDTSTTSTPTRVVPSPVPLTTTRRTRASTLTPIPPIPVTSRRTSLPVDTWTTVIRTTALEPPSVYTTTEVASEYTALESSRAAASIPAAADVTSSYIAGDEAAPSEESTNQVYAQSEVLLSPSSASGVSSASQRTTVETLNTAAANGKPTAPNSAESNQEDNESGMEGGAKANLVIGVLAAVGIALLALLFWRRRAKIAKRRRILIQQINAMRHRRDQSDYSWNGSDSDWPAPVGEKSNIKEESAQSAHLSPPILRSNLPASTGRSKLTWSIFAPARPPSRSSRASASISAPQDPRISIIAPSPASSRANLLATASQSSRASSALSGNHLHPLYIYGTPQRPLSTRSRESLASEISPSGEGSPVLAELASRFPIPNQQGPDMNNLLLAQSALKPLVSNNPFRASTANPIPRYGATPQRYSQTSVTSNNEGVNPFEFETETGALDIDFSRIGVTPVPSGHSTVNPTTPITPRNRRKSTSSLSLYSQEGHAAPSNPFSEEGPSYQTTHSNRQTFQRDSVNEALGMSDKAYRPWSPLGIDSGETSRKESFVSTRSGPDQGAWEGEMAHIESRTSKSFDRMLDLYSGLAM